MLVLLRIIPSSYHLVVSTHSQTLQTLLTMSKSSYLLCSFSIGVWDRGRILPKRFMLLAAFFSTLHLGGTGFCWVIFGQWRLAVVLAAPTAPCPGYVGATEKARELGHVAPQGWRCLCGLSSFHLPESFFAGFWCYVQCFRIIRGKTKVSGAILY